MLDEIKNFVLQEASGSSNLFVENFLAVENTKTKKQEAKEEDIALPQGFNLEEIKHTKVLLVTSTTINQELELIKRLTLAINQNITKAYHVEGSKIQDEKAWKSIFHNAKSVQKILISELELYQNPSLMMHYKKMPARSLFNIPLFLLADLSSYNQDPELKKSLWSYLKHEL